VTQAEAAFDPVLFVTPDFQYQERQTAGSIFPDLSTGTINTVTAFHQKTEAFSLAGGIRQNLPSGGQARLTYTTAFTDNRPKQFLIDPFWENTMLLEVQQPLLRGFGSAGVAARAQININRNQQRISLLDFRQAMEKAVADIEKTYWQLAQAERDVRIQEALLQRTVESAQLLQRREAQDATRVQTSQANAAVEQRRVALSQARSDVRVLSTQLKQMVNDPDLSVTSAVLLLPANQPSEEPFHFDLEDQVTTALDNRLELAQQQLKIDTARIGAEFYKTNRLPQLNLILNAGWNGVNDDPWEAGSAQGFIGRVGFQFEVPIGNREAEAQYQQALLKRAQAIEQYSGLVSQIVSDVTQARERLYAAWDGIAAARQSRFASAEALRVILLLEASEQPKNPEFIQLKLQRQQDLADSERAEAAALANYNIAIAGLEQAKGTILRYNNIIMEQRPEPFSVKPTPVSVS
jgi:outer membrane protein